MAEEIHHVHIDNLPVTENGGLRVELIPMPAGDNPWRMRADYIQEQRRDTFRFFLTIASLVNLVLQGVAVLKSFAMNGKVVRLIRIHFFENPELVGQ